MAESDTPPEGVDAALYRRIRALHPTARAEALYFLAGARQHEHRHHQALLEALNVVGSEVRHVDHPGMAESDTPPEGVDAALYRRIRALSPTARADALYFLAGARQHGHRDHQALLEALSDAERWQSVHTAMEQSEESEYDAAWRAQETVPDT